MAPHLERYEILSPHTSRSLRIEMRKVIDDGSRTLELQLKNTTSAKTFVARFELRQTRYGIMSTEYFGELIDHGIATITVMSHSDLSDTPARLKLSRPPTP